MSKYDYEYERVNSYCYPNSFVLVNKLNIRDAKALSEAEREITAARIAGIMDDPVRGKFDFKHLCAIHRAVFGDFYWWAGEIRTINIAKGNQFCLYPHILAYADGIFSKLKGDRPMRRVRG